MCGKSSRASYAQNYVLLWSAQVVLRTFPKMVDVAGVFFTLLVLYSVAGAVLFNFVHVPDGPAGYLVLPPPLSTEHVMRHSLCLTTCAPLPQPANDNFNNTGHAALALYIFTTTVIEQHKHHMLATALLTCYLHAHTVLTGELSHGHVPSTELSTLDYFHLLPLWHFLLPLDVGAAVACYRL